MASFQERMALLAAQLPTKKTKQEKKQEAAIAALVTENPPDFELTTNGQIGSLRTPEGSSWPTKVEQQATNISIAIIDVSGSMDPFKRTINEIVSQFIAKSSAANLPAGQLTIVCFASGICATIDMSQPYTQNIVRMSGGTNYGVAFKHVATLVSQMRTQYPNARFNISFMTDGGDCDNQTATPAALADLHEQLSGDEHLMTAVFFSARSGDQPPATLHKVSKPSIPANQIPVMLLTNPSYFSNWLLGALETSVTRTSLDFSVRDATGTIRQRHLLLNNNGETIMGSLLFSGVTEDVVAEGILTSGGQSWPCRILVKKPEPPAPMTSTQIMQLLQTVIDDSLRLPESQLASALAQIQQVVRLSENAEVRAKLTEAEIKLLKRAMTNAAPTSTSGSLTSQRLEQRRSLTELLTALQFETHLTTGKMRRQARAIQKLDTRVAESASKVRQMVTQLQNSLEELQKSYLAASLRPTRSNGGTTTAPRPFDEVALDTIDPSEVVVSLWTAPDVNDSNYMGNVALNMGNVRAQPVTATPWIGLTNWAQMCNENLTTTNSTQIGIPVLDHHPSQLTEIETKVVSLMAPLLCGLFATAQLIVDRGHVAVSQLFTTIGHTLQTIENRAEAEKFANVLLPYAWHLYKNLGYNAMTIQSIEDRFKDDKNCIGSATAWLGFVYCHKQMVPAQVCPLTPEQQFKIYKQELLRTVAKRLHDTSEARNTQRLEAFAKEVRDTWPTLTAQTKQEINDQTLSSWNNQKTLQATVDRLVASSVEVIDNAKVDTLLQNLLNSVGSEIKPSYRLAPGVLRGKEALRPWSVWTPTTLNIHDIYNVVKYATSGVNTMSEADKQLGGGFWSNEMKNGLVSLLALNPELLTSEQWWVILLLCPSVTKIHSHATIANLVSNDDNLNLLATGDYPHVRDWFKQQIIGPDNSTNWPAVIKIMANSKFVSDSCVQYWFIIDLKTPQHLFAPFQGPAQDLWRDNTRACRPSMNVRLSKPGNIVSDNGTRRIVNKIEFVKDAAGHDTNVVHKVTFLDGSTMTRNIAGGQRNSVTAHALTKPFEISYGQYDRVKVLCAGLDSCGLTDVFTGEGPVVEEQLTSKQEMKIGLNNVVGYVCTRYQGHWILESIYQKTNDGHYIDVMARGDLAYFSEVEEH